MALLDLHAASGIKFRRFGRWDLSTRLALWRSRRDLAKLDARALEDVGISAQAAQDEAKMGIWDVPATWVNR